MSQLHLDRRPEARTDSVEDLVARVLRGRVRVPTFQRGLKWERSDVRDLFDSIFHGYPIGSLLFYVGKAKAERLMVGPLEVVAEESSEAWWVVDGQQRVTALAAGLGRPLPLPEKPDAADKFVVYFNAAKQEFTAPPMNGQPDSAWVPLPVLLDASRLSEWVFRWAYRDDEDLRRGVFEAGRRLREYTVPLYVIEAEDEQIAKEIFYRTNTAGKPLAWEDVHKALYGGSKTSPSTLPELEDDLASVGMGRVGERRLLTCLFALRGLDPTRSFDELYRNDTDALRDAVQEALPVLRRVLSFLRSDCLIPHLRFLPKSILLDVLTRFFSLHPEPNPRTRLLLARWFWRAAVGAGAFDERTLRRRGIQAVEEDSEEGSVQALLQLVRKEPQRPFELPASFDPRADASRLALLAMAQAAPRHLLDQRPLEIADLVTEYDKDCFCKILVRSGLDLARSPANRLIHPPGVEIEKALRAIPADTAMGLQVLESHGIDREAQKLLTEDPERFLSWRRQSLTEQVRRFIDREAAWEHGDRPSIDHLLKEAGVQL